MFSKKKGLFFTILLIVSAFIFAGCGNDEGGKNSSDNSSSGGDSGSNETLIVYTNSNSDGRGEWVIEKAKEAGFNIELVTAGGGEVTNRLISEKANPIADVVYGLNHIFFEQLQAQDVIIPYVPKWADEIEAGINDPDGYYHGLVKQALILAYNPEFVDSDKIPSSYLDLGNDGKYAGIYQARDDLSAATAKVIVASILSQFRDDNGEFGVSKEGWEFMKRYFDNGVQIPEGENYFSIFASGMAPIGTIISGELTAKSEQYGATPEFIYPEVGTPLVVEGIAVVKGTKKEKLAQEFIDWFGSAEVQGEFAETFGAVPANTKATDKINDNLKEIFSNIKGQDIDWEFVSNNIDAWVEKLELEIF